MLYNLGPLSTAEVERFMQEALLTGDEGASPEVKFVRQAASISIDRYKQGERGIALFLGFEGNIRNVVSNIRTISKPMLVSCKDNICNSVWISDYAFNRAVKCCDHENVSDSNFEDILENLNFAGEVTFVADLRGSAPVAFIYLNGINDASTRIVAQLFYGECEQINVTDLKETLDRFHHYIKTPQGASSGHQLKIWRDAAKGIPGDSPELQIQSRLLDSLRAKYVSHDIRTEGRTDLGRFDICVSRKHESEALGKFVKVEWILELKALTDMTTTGTSKHFSTIQEAIQSGVQQAKSYQKSEGSQNTALCCYVMTKEQLTDTQLFSQVADQASEGAIHLWSWYLFRSSKEARQAESEQASGMNVLSV